ncbi:hypothetical protein ACROYT_G041736 [Oculina patagonica]
MFHFCLLLIILGTITVHGAIYIDTKRASHVLAKRSCTGSCVSHSELGCGYTGRPCPGSCPVGERCCCYRR